VLASDGDWGTANTDKQDRVYPFPTQNWPASDPLVTACGGTQLQWGWRWTPACTPEEFWAEVARLGDWEIALPDSGFQNSAPSSIRTEVVWNEASLPLATGGGLSALFGTPAFQSGLPQSLLRGRRGVPDISWNAAGNGGVLIYVSGDYLYPTYLDGWVLVAGTSASTPQLAGVIALANQLRAQKGKQPIGYLNPVLYRLPARDFNDIVPQTFGPAQVTLDNNELFGSGIAGYPTTPGYDLTTGLGSPKAYQFVHDLADVP
jgi:subtilase family serine protease